MKGAENHNMELEGNTRMAKDLLIKKLMELKDNVDEYISDIELWFELKMHNTKDSIDNEFSVMRRNIKDIFGDLTHYADFGDMFSTVEREKKNIDNLLNASTNLPETYLSEELDTTDVVQKLFDDIDSLPQEDDTFMKEKFNEIVTAVNEVWKEFELALPTLYKKREKLDEFLAAEYSRKLINLNRWLFDIVRLDDHYLNKQEKINSYKGDLELILELFFSLFAFEKTVLKLGIEDFKVTEIEKIYDKLKLSYEDLCLLDVWKL